MKRSVMWVCCLAVLGGAGIATAGESSVTLTANGPQPGTVTASVGDTIRFQNVDTAEHQILVRGAPTPTINLAPQASATITLSQAGTLSYQQRGATRFRGAIVVSPLVAARALTLTAVKPFITYGQVGILRGVAPQAGQQVLVEQRVQGVASWVEVTRATAA